MFTLWYFVGGAPSLSIRFADYREKVAILDKGIFVIELRPDAGEFLIYDGSA